MLAFHSREGCVCIIDNAVHRNHVSGKKKAYNERIQSHKRGTNKEGNRNLVKSLSRKREIETILCYFY